MLNVRQSNLRRGVIEPLLALCIFLFLGMVGFAVLSITLLSQKQTLNNQLAAAQQQYYQAGQKAQQTSDAAATLKAGESPYLTYTAPTWAGSFMIPYPKNWSIQVDQTQDSSTQINLLANPVSIQSTQGQPLPVALQVQLVAQPSSQVDESYNGQVTSGQLTSTNMTVSGIAATRYTGTFNSNGQFKGVLVVVPVRDTSILLWNEVAAQEPEFEQILATAMIHP